MKNYAAHIHMGASSWTVEVRGKNKWHKFNLNKMQQKEQRNFVKELVIAFREARCL